MTGRLLLVLASITIASTGTEVTLRACRCARFVLAIPATK
jgi:hypothetical protein